MLITFFLGALSMLMVCNASTPLEQASKELYLCNYVWNSIQEKKWLVYFECFYTLDETTITSEYKTLVVLSKKEMFVVSGWRY